MRALSISLFALTTGCAPAIQLTVLEPADVFVPQHIQTVAYVDRSVPKNVGQGVLGAVEGLLTGEGLGVDTQGRHRAGDAVKEVLQASPRFEVVVPVLSNEQAESSLFDKEMSWKAARAICKEVACQGIVALEAFDSDSLVETRTEVVTEQVDGREVKKKQWVAQRETSVLTAWRLYDVQGKVVVDDLRDWKERNTWDARAATEEQAIANLPGQARTVEDMAQRSGKSYGRRIAPTYVIVARRMYKRGHDSLKIGVEHAMRSEWVRADKQWRKVYEGADPKLKARAAYNMAVDLERQGRLHEALTLAREASRLGDKPRMNNYVRTLQERKRDADKLQQQMGG
ncbi:MAG: DUF6340 family protein [Myxococcota bacterium]|nr:DUF6340 family protein [Myxococcota bacterium]